jgi:hypothetical protein
MRRYLDRSTLLSNAISFLSNSLARQRGLVPVIGISFIAVGFILLLMNVFVGAAVIEFFGILLQGTGILLALIGLLLAEPLGK